MAPPPPVRGVDEPDMSWGLNMGEAHGLGIMGRGPPPPIRGVDLPDMSWGLDMGEAHGLGLMCRSDRGCSRELVFCENVDGTFHGT